VGSSAHQQFRAAASAARLKTTFEAQRWRRRKRPKKYFSSRTSALQEEQASRGPRTSAPKKQKRSATDGAATKARHRT
jgi:hypothetical protein